MRQAYFSSIDQAPVRELSGGRGRSLRLVDPGVGEAHHVDVHLNEIKVASPPGPLHYHERSENVYIILEGRVEVVVEGHSRVLGPDEVAFIPPGLRHSVTNVGTTTARLVEIYAPPGPDFHLAPAVPQQNP